MSLIDTFNSIQSVESGASTQRRGKKRLAPFSLRLTDSERARLTEEAKGVPLGAYIKAKALGYPARLRQTGIAPKDRQALAQLLALLGQSRLSVSLAELASAAGIGALPMTPETEAELLAAVRDVRSIRILLVHALGLKAEDGP